MAVSNFDIAVVSRFGSGHWLAAEFASARMNVLLIDQSSKMGAWPLEDIEGPFGVVRLDRYDQSFVERLNQDDPIALQENGWTFWLPEGPLEMSGPLSQFHFQKMGIPATWPEAWGKGETLAFTKTQQTPFSSYWSLALSKQLASTTFRDANHALQGTSLPLCAPFGVRMTTRAGLQTNFKWLRDKGVTVIDDGVIRDIAFQGRGHFQGLEIHSSTLAGLSKCHFLLWTLTGAETEFLSKDFAKELYPGGLVDPAWCWMRFRLSVQEDIEIAQMPWHSVLIQDIDQPWSHANMVVMVKTPVPGRMDAWARVPAHQRFNSSYLQHQGEKILHHLGKKWSRSKAEIQSLPQESLYPEHLLGPARVPVWHDGVVPYKGRVSSKNVFFENCENRPGHSTDAEYDAQVKVRDQVLKSHHMLLSRQKKEATA